MFRFLRRLLLGLAVAGPALADPGYYLLTPYSQPGQRAVDLRYWTVQSARGKTLWPEAGLRYGVNERWTTELFASFIGPALDAQRLSSLNWQNSVLLTQGQYPFDVAVHSQLIRQQGSGHAFELGPVLQTEWGLTQLNLNLVFAHDAAAHDGTQLKLQWQALHRLQAGLRVGVQGFGELGRWNHRDDPASLRAGPVLRVALFDQAELQAAYLWGRTYGHRGNMLSTQLLLPF